MSAVWIWVASLTAAREWNWETMPLLLAPRFAHWGPSLAVTLPVRPATPMRGKCATESAAKVQEASKEHARWGSTGHLRLHSATSVRRKFL